MSHAGPRYTQQAEDANLCNLLHGLADLHAILSQIGFSKPEELRVPLSLLLELS